jgi:hypothetical protein
MPSMFDDVVPWRMLPSCPVDPETLAVVQRIAQLSKTSCASVVRQVMDQWAEGTGDLLVDMNVWRWPDPSDIPAVTFHGEPN